MGMKKTEIGMIPEEWNVQSFFDTFLLSGKLNDAPSGRLFRADLEFLQRCPSL